MLQITLLKLTFCDSLRVIEVAQVAEVNLKFLKSIIEADTIYLKLLKSVLSCMEGLATVICFCWAAFTDIEIFQKTA